MTFIHDFSPILATIGPVSIRWYGVLFATGLVLGYFVVRWAFKKAKYKVEHLDSITLYLFFGMVIGARLGEVLFYEPGYFFSNPVEILQIWKGGLSSHGAAIGLFVSYLIWLKVYKVKFSKYADLIALGLPLVATFVRIGNFMNSEIVGKVSESGFGVVFKRLGENTARHPAQLYEGLWSLIVFGVLIVLFKKFYGKVKPLFFMFFYILLYFGGRFVLEFWKDVNSLPDAFVLNTGQILSFIPILISIVYFVGFYKRIER